MVKWSVRCIICKDKNKIEKNWENVKINDIFSGKGISKHFPSSGDANGMDITIDLATESVPLLNFLNSNTPIGPFQMIVFAFLISLAKIFLVFLPISIA